MDKQQIKEELLKEVGSEFEPVVGTVIDRMEQFLVNNLCGKVVKPGETFWLRGVKYITQTENDGCLDCEFRNDSNCLTYVPECQNSNLIFKKA